MFDQVYAGMEKITEDQTFISARKRNTGKARLIECERADIELVKILENSQLESNTAQESSELDGSTVKNMPRTVNDIQNGNTDAQLYENEDKFSANFESKENKVIIRNENVDSKSKIEFGTFICDYCKRVFQKKLWLISHIVAHKKKNKWQLKKHPCNTCNQKFSTKSDLINHKIKKHEIDFKYYSCPDCSYKTTAGSYKLAQHMSMHEAMGMYNCQLCSYETNDKSNLKRHILTHTEQKPFQCDICGAGFRQSQHLKKHMNIHDINKPSSSKNYNCSICKCSFRKRSDFIIHSRIHSGQKPFQCTLCESTFARKNGLTRHLMVHTQERSLKCTICGTEFKLLSGLKRHMVNHHNIVSDKLKSQTDNTEIDGESTMLPV